MESLTQNENNACGNVTFMPYYSLQEVACPLYNGTHKKCKSFIESFVCCDPSQQTDCKGYIN